MKRMMIPLLAAVLCAGCMLASFGALSDDRRLPGQNAFGGYGAVCSAGNSSQRFFYDETSFYYPAAYLSWNPYSDTVRTMFTYDFETGESSPVCKRISCTHSSAACPLHPLFSGGENLQGVWCMIDGCFAAPRMTSDSLEINKWDVLSGSTESFFVIPRYRELPGSDTLGVTYESFFESVSRPADDRVLIQYNNEAHYFDNEMHELFSFPCSSMHDPMTAGRKLFWFGLTGDLRCVSLDTGKTETGITKNLPVSGIRDGSNPFAGFAYGSEIFFPQGSRVYALDAESYTLRTVTEIDPASEEEPYACFGTGGLMYYRLHGTVYCMTLDTGAVTACEDIPKVPCAAVRDMLLYVSPQPDGTDDIAVYRSGRAVQP